MKVFTRQFCSKVMKEYTFNRSTHIAINKFKALKDLEGVETKTENMKKLIKNKIKATGPISIEEYMRLCLYDKNYGYYTSKEYIFGSNGDFITSPEVSQLFGESISVFIYKILEQWGFPKEYELLEIGAGRGYMMSDILRSLYRLGYLKGCTANIVDTSDKLIKIQQENINNTLLKSKIFTEYKYDSV